MFEKSVTHNWGREVDGNYKGMYKAKIIIRADGHWTVSSVIMDQGPDCVRFCSLFHPQCFAECQRHSGLLAGV